MSFVDALPEADLPDGSMRACELDGQPVLLARVEGTVYAVAGLCTHGLAYLEEGDLDGFEIQCPLHIGRFDVRTGQPTKRPATVPLKAYPVKIEGGRIWVDV